MRVIGQREHRPPPQFADCGVGHPAHVGCRSIVARTGQGAFRSLPMTEFACDLFPRAWEFRTGVTERRGSDDCFTVSKMDRADVACHGAGARRCPRARSTERVRGSKSAQRGTGTGPRPGSGGGHPDSARSTSAQRRAGPRHRGRVSIRLPRQPRQYRSARPLHPDDQARPLRAHAGLSATRPTARWRRSPIGLASASR